MSSNSILLSTAYLPNLEYIKHIIDNEVIVLEAHEHFIKQTYRNRCDILTANGKLTLSIPLVKQADKEIIIQKKIAYAENWQQQHWRSITSAYKNSPYFDYFEDEFKPFYTQQYEFLFEYNIELLKTILKLLRKKKEIIYTTSYETTPTHLLDLRYLSSLKNNVMQNTKPYYQVFAGKLGFTPQLSCIDALFNVGLDTMEL